MLLTIDTSAGTAVAVVDPDARTVLAERGTDDSRRHAEVIGPLLAEVLAEAGIRPEDLTGVVAGMGPGPFTGLRVGIVAARTFAAARGIPVLPLVSHDAVAAETLATDGPGPVVVVTDARRREVYWSAYAAAGDASDASRSSRLSAFPVRTVGPGLAKPADLDAALGDAAGHRRVTAATVPAGRLGLLAAELLASGGPFAADEPLYLRDPDVTMPGTPKRVRA
ncbi:tRNA (adenosine(37)-N6)-threonylcarbamoyltransferase complex dimerization subunit type 1 TsaB [Curtobacterium sp. RRHDQ10]|uniref:tRNA (adenosine(37)-N6)-threonylcarbamoyltransferase complex dimerization subunit type 1 TsaB n=1 Tax=Curtobacterium phyllosphaerae TaxID=3413379 RepID=UPI003BEFDFEE